MDSLSHLKNVIPYGRLNRANIPLTFSLQVKRKFLKGSYTPFTPPARPWLLPGQTRVGRRVNGSRKKNTGRVILDYQFQGRWLRQEAQLTHKCLGTARNCECLADNILRGRAIRAQSDNASAVEYVNRQGGMRSRAAMREVCPILLCAECHATALSAVFVPGVDFWEADYLSRQDLHQGSRASIPTSFTRS